MSVIAVKVYEDRIEIAADSILVHGDTKRTDSNFNKLFKIGDMVVGSTGDAQEASLFMHYCQENQIQEGSEKAILDFLCGFKTWQSKFFEPSNIENEYIIVVKDKVFSTTGLFVEEVKSFDAVGAGQDFALGVLYLGHSPSEAVKVASELCCYVSEPVVEYVVEKKKSKTKK